MRIWINRQKKRLLAGLAIFLVLLALVVGWYVTSQPVKPSSVSQLKKEAIPVFVSVRNMTSAQRAELLRKADRVPARQLVQDECQSTKIVPDSCTSN